MPVDGMTWDAWFRKRDSASCCYCFGQMTPGLSVPLASWMALLGSYF